MDYGDLTRVRIVLDKGNVDWLAQNGCHIFITSGNWWHVRKGDKWLSAGMRDPDALIRQVRSEQE